MAVTSIVLTNVGRAFCAQRLDGTVGPMTHIGCGTGSTAANVADTALGTEVETRAAVTRSNVTTTITNDTLRHVGTVTFSATRTMREAGLFSASSAGTMMIRLVHDAIGVASGDAITYTIDFQQT